MSIGIIIINFNGVSDTQECLKSIESLYSKQNIQVFLIENDSLNCIKEDFINSLNFKITQIINTVNKGFAEGNNIGIKKAIEAGCEYIALINNDTVFVDDSLLKVINCFEDNFNFGIIGIINYYYSNPEIIWQAGFRSNLFLGYSKKIKTNNTAMNVVPVDYVPGSSIVIRKSVFEENGFLDERYFAYFEEYDFCIRAKKKKINIGFLNGTKILHKVGKSSTSSIKLYLRTRNKLLFYHKHGSALGFVIAFAVHAIISIKRIVFLKNDKGRLIKAFLFGFKDYYNEHFYKGSIENIK
tara:strand:- start:141 stop:1031 length:891 start_codon:yes stop_codon:yes gene_type:complete